MMATRRSELAGRNNVRCTRCGGKCQRFNLGMWLDSMPNFAASMAFEMHQLVKACAASLVREACCLDKSLIYVAALAAPRHATSSSVSELGEVGLELINEVSVCTVIRGRFTVFYCLRKRRTHESLLHQSQL